MIVQSLVIITMQHFTTQLRDEQETTRTLRASHYKKARKQQNIQDEDEPPTGVEAEDEDETQENSRSRSYALLAAPEIAQLRVAGLLPEDGKKVPPAPFPHAPGRVSKDHYGPAKVQEEMARSPSRLYALNATSKGDAVLGQRGAQKKTQLNNLSTLMHRCLLEGNYARAGRAWGMILRTQVVGGRPVDPRNHGRWGIGAEIALRRKQQTHGEQQLEPQSTEPGRFSEEGFALAREYYDRLLIQYPHRRTQPHAVDNRTFYAPMFSLWIYEVCEKSKRAKLQLQDESANQSRSSRSISVDSVSGEKPDDSRAKEATQLDELTRAMEIAERLDQVMASPPFDKHSNLLQLRGNVGLWISDLTIGKTGLDEDWDTDVPARNRRDSGDEPVVEEQRRYKNAQRELQQARTFFERAAANGTQGQAATMSNIDIKLREVAKHLKKLQLPSR
jgi:hypothetical protein